ncbi:MAG: hypothetical protein J6V53_01335 [Alphaproteobacteria bacterium]|nr:hypothetical protein [Alphaproteobacteria bacterium]
MKILIIGALGAGKSTLAYKINKEWGLTRLNLDEIARCKEDGSFRSKEEYLKLLQQFLSAHPDNWVAEGSHPDLIRNVNPNIIIYVTTNRLIRLFRFTFRFIKAKKLIGKNISPDLPVQAYHYRKLSLKKIRDYDVSGIEIINDLKEFFKTVKVPIIKYKNEKDLKDILQLMENKND